MVLHKGLLHTLVLETLGFEEFIMELLDVNNFYENFKIVLEVFLV